MVFPDFADVLLYSFVKKKVFALSNVSMRL